MKKAAALIILSVVTVFSFNRYRRSSKTREAFEAVAVPGSLKAQLLARGCDRVAVLPLIDFSRVSIDSLDGSRDDTMFAMCEFIETSPHIDCRHFFSELAPEQTTQVYVEISDDWCEATVEPDGRMMLPPRIPAEGSTSIFALVGRVLAYR